MLLFIFLIMLSLSFNNILFIDNILVILKMDKEIILIIIFMN